MYSSQMIGAGMLGVGIYNIVSIQSFGVFARDEYITGGVIFVIVGIAKIILSIVGIIGWGTGWKYLLGVVSKTHSYTYHLFEMRLIPILFIDLK